MPEIRYLEGVAVRSVPDWAEQVADYASMQSHLLPQEPVALRAVAEQGLVTIAIDPAAGDLVVGCAALWPLGVESHGAPWHELGTVFVRAGYRRSDHRGLAISDALYDRVKRTFPHLNILATTTAVEALQLGRRAGFHHVGFHALAEAVQKATCVCPSTKTRSTHPRDCTIRDGSCFVRVTPGTWERMGGPTDLEFPDSALVQIVRSVTSAR